MAGRRLSVAVIVAHPDDETLWAGGTLLLNDWDLLIACLSRRSDLNRAPRFERAVQIYGGRAVMADLNDEPEQEPLHAALVQQTVAAIVSDTHDIIITHGKRGEYTRHLRHEETYEAVLALWAAGTLKARELWTFAYEDGGGMYLPRAAEEADKRAVLAEDVWQQKYSIITSVYGFSAESFEALTTPRVEAFNVSYHPGMSA